MQRERRRVRMRPRLRVKRPIRVREPHIPTRKAKPRLRRADRHRVRHTRRAARATTRNRHVIRDHPRTRAFFHLDRDSDPRHRHHFDLRDPRRRAVNNRSRHLRQESRVARTRHDRSTNNIPFARPIANTNPARPTDFVLFFFLRTKDRPTKRATIHFTTRLHRSQPSRQHIRNRNRTHARLRADINNVRPDHTIRTPPGHHHRLRPRSRTNRTQPQTIRNSLIRQTTHKRHTIRLPTTTTHHHITHTKNTFQTRLHFTRPSIKHKQPSFPKNHRNRRTFPHRRQPKLPTTHTTNPKLPNFIPRPTRHHTRRTHTRKHLPTRTSHPRPSRSSHKQRHDKHAQDRND